MLLDALHAAHRRPPSTNPDKPFPDTASGPYDFANYHANDKGRAMGFRGSTSESNAAYDEFKEKQMAILREAGLGADGKGDWDNLARTGGLSRIDPNYLQKFGFSEIGGEGFTLLHGFNGLDLNYN